MRSAEIGRWMRTNGESVYGTSASPFKDLAWGRATAKLSGDESTNYLHLFDWPTDCMLRIGNDRNAMKVRSCVLLATGKNVPASIGQDGIALELPAQPIDAVDTIIKLVVAKQIETRTGTPDIPHSNRGPRGK